MNILAGITSGKKTKRAGTNPIPTDPANENGEKGNTTPPNEGGNDTDSEFDEGDSYIML